MVHNVDDPDPYVGKAPFVQTLAWAFADGLVATDTAGTLVPALATALPQRSEDGLTYRYTLRDDVRWHDGAPLRADDVVAVHRRLQQRPDLRSTPPFDNVVNVAAAGRELTVTLRAPLGAFAESFFGPKGALPIPLVRPGAIGTGPLRVAQVHPNVDLTLRKANGGPRGSARFDTLEIRTIPDPNSLLVAYEAHEIDLALYPPAEAASAYARAGAQIFRQDGTSMMIVANTRSGPLHDTALRRAVFALVPREEIVRTVFGGWIHRSSLLPQPQLPDTATAHALVERARPHLRIISTMHGYPGKVALLLQQALQEAGASVELKSLSIPQFFALDGPIHKGEYDLTLWFTDLVGRDLRAFLGCDGLQNVSGWCDHRFDALEARGTAAAGSTAESIFSQADTLLDDAAPMLPLGRLQLAIAASPQLRIDIDQYAPLFMHVEHWRA